MEVAGYNRNDSYHGSGDEINREDDEEYNPFHDNNTMECLPLKDFKDE
jgi:hypothetical protein